jgi:hypothetical protein
LVAILPHIHIVVADLVDPKTTIIVEIPAPERAEGTGREEEYRATRKIADGLKQGENIEVFGVGFWDFIHAQLELHPVFNITIYPITPNWCAKSVCPSSAPTSPS